MGHGSSLGGSAAGWPGPDSRRLTARRSKMGTQLPDRWLLALREGPDPEASLRGPEPLGKVPEALPGAHLLGRALIRSTWKTVLILSALDGSWCAL